MRKVKFLQSKYICMSTLSYALHTLCGGHFRPLTGSAPKEYTTQEASQHLTVMTVAKCCTDKFCSRARNSHRVPPPPPATMRGSSSSSTIT